MARPKTINRYAEKSILLHPFSHYYLLWPSMDSVETSVAAKRLPQLAERFLLWWYLTIPVLRKKIDIGLPLED